MKQCHRAFHIAVHLNVRVYIVVAELVGGDLQALALEVHAVVVANCVGLLLAQDVGEVAVDEWHVCRARQGDVYAELAVVACAIGLLQMPVGACHVLDSGLGQFLGQPALGASGRPARSCRAPQVTKSRNVLDAELVERASHPAQIELVDLATGLGREEVVAASVDYRLANSP